MVGPVGLGDGGVLAPAELFKELMPRRVSHDEEGVQLDDEVDEALAP